MATTTIINSLTLTSIPALPSANANITGSVRLPQFKGLKIIPSLKTRSSGSLGQNPSSKLARGARVVCMAGETAGGGLKTMTVQTYGDLYNGTKDTVTCVISHDWFGEIGIPSYPDYIKVGNWGKFTHKGTADKSSAAVVYHAKNIVGNQCDILLAWSKDSGSSNKAYTEIQEAGYNWDWDHIGAQLERSSSQSNSTYNGCVSEVELGDRFTATLSLTP